MTWFLKKVLLTLLRTSSLLHIFMKPASAMPWLLSKVLPHIRKRHMTALTLTLTEAPPVEMLGRDRSLPRVTTHPTTATTWLLSKALPDGRKSPTTALTLTL